LKRFESRDLAIPCGLAVEEGPGKWPPHLGSWERLSVNCLSRKAKCRFAASLTGTGVANLFDPLPLVVKLCGL